MMDRYIEITKKQARERYNSGKIVRLMASNLNPHSCWGEPLPVTMTKNGNTTFEQVCNGFAYHNCTKETGKSIRFYIKEGEI